MSPPSGWPDLQPFARDQNRELAARDWDPSGIATGTAA